MNRPFNIMLIEPNALLCKGLGIWLQEQSRINSVEVHCTLALVHSTQLQQVDVVLMDLTTEEEFEVVKSWRHQYPDLKFIFLSSIDRLFENYLFAITEKNCIQTFLTKDIHPEELLVAIEQTVNKTTRELHIDPSVKAQLFGQSTNEKAVFTEKEISVLNLLGRGRTTKETAKEMNLSFRTIETHRRRMIEKLGCKNIIPVILYALQYQYIEIKIEDLYFY